MQETSDIHLLGLCLAGDRDAYGQLVARYQGLICSMAYSACGNVSRSEDLAQETFITAWKKLKDLREGAKFKSWLCGIARNLINNSIRRQSRTATDGAVELDAVFDSASPLPTPSEQAVTADEAALVWQSLEEIPETYREPLVLFYREEHSVERVAEALDLSQDAVKQRLSRGRKLLRDRVASLVENTLSHSRPGKTFTTAVLVALPALVPQIATAGVAATAAKGSTIAKTAALAGVTGAILGPVIGLLGAWIGIRAGINATQSPRERQFMIKAGWITMGLAGGFVVSLLALILLGRGLARENAPLFAGMLLTLISGYTIAITALAVWINRRATQIRKEDGTYVEPEAAIGGKHGQLTASAIHGSFAGGIFGGCAWMYILAGKAQDWIGLAILIAVTVSAFLLSSHRCLKNPRSYFKVLLTTFGGIGAFILLILNLRWDLWLGSEIKNDAANFYTRFGVNGLIVLIFAVILINWWLNPARRRRR
jgi:RNA polymerase sigma factor (sigma-70 family)